jgi:hypothetical protein
MNRFCLLLIAAAGALWQAFAQSAPVAGLADAQAKVAPPEYQSASEAYHRAAEPEDTPDKLWLRANRELAGQSAHEHGAHDAASTQMEMAPSGDPKAKSSPSPGPVREPAVQMKGQ